MAVSKRTRFECFKRDKFACQYCGRTPPAVVLEADHVVPVAGGGPDDINNLVTACFDCNRGKSDVPLTSVPKPLADVMAAATEKAEQVAAYNAFLMEVREAEQEQVRQIGLYWFNKLATKKNQNRYSFGEERAASIKTFLRRLPAAEILEAVDIAHARTRPTFDRDDQGWKYFCGVCWKKIRDAEGV